MTYRADNKRALEFSCSSNEEENLARAVLNNDVGQTRKLLLQQGDELRCLLSGDFGSCLLCVVFEHGSLDMIRAFKEFNLSIQDIAWHGYDASSHGPFVSTRYSGIAMASFSQERLQFLVEHNVLHPLNDESGVREGWRNIGGDGRLSSTCLSMGLCYNNDDVYQYLKKWYVGQWQQNLSEYSFFQVLEDMHFHLTSNDKKELKSLKIKQRLRERIEDIISALYEKMNTKDDFPPTTLQKMTKENDILNMLMWERHLKGKEKLVVDAVGRALVSKNLLADFSFVLPFMTLKGVMECMEPLTDIVNEWAKTRPEIFHHTSYSVSLNILKALAGIETRLGHEGFEREQHMIKKIIEDKNLWISSYGRNRDDDIKILENLCLNLRMLPYGLNKTSVKKKM